MLKKHIISNLIGSDNLDENDPEAENILVISNINQMHDHLNQKGVDDDQFLDVLKGYFENG